MRLWCPLTPKSLPSNLATVTVNSNSLLVCEKNYNACWRCFVHYHILLEYFFNALVWNNISEYIKLLQMDFANWTAYTNERIHTFSLLRNSSNICSISKRQSSCIVWKESWGVVIKDDVAISCRRCRISKNVGLSWGSWYQQSANERC